MDKKVIKSLMVIGLLIFIISFFITSFTTKESDKAEETISTNTKKISLIDELKRQGNIQISNENLKYITVEDEFLDNFKYYLRKAEKLDKNVDFKCKFKGRAKDIEFFTDFNYLKISQNKRSEYYKFPSNDKKNIEKLFDKEIYTAFDAVKNYENWNTVVVEYSGKKKEISDLKKFNEQINKKRKISQYQATKIADEAEENFYITVKTDNYEFYIQTIGRNAIGVYYKDYKSYYEIDRDFYNYLCDICFVAKKKNKEKSEYDWVENIQVKDIVNNIEETFEKEQKDDILNSLFNDDIKEVKFDKYEVKRYILRLNGKGNSEEIVIYENYVKKGGKYYKIKNADLIIDSFLNVP
ncbi:hypothetical protein [Tepidibacter thalassicus]|uniref:Uncharacterized protein n=1 Tax=Tepidibacter thalassicus DSM 15285 TaxID=1123350 RepID=A0A1M5SHP4_9FIRM|nr:hypothetical protein [Tepidibacter thalassicus]SHH38112.1 hypothetical protein SAMN02744040_01778 [Tepidibacter thalassicus DSM 15285]